MAQTETFAKRVKSELALKTPASRKGQKALLSGFVRPIASLSIGSNPVLTLRTEVSNAAKMAYSLFRTLYSLTPSFIFERKMRFDKSIVYVIRVEGECIYSVMDDLKCVRDLRPIPLRSLVNPDNIQNFCQGLFIAQGSVNSPEGKSYFLEITLTSELDATILCQALKAVNPRFVFKVVSIRDKFMIYLKKSSEIAEFLAWLGATDAALEYENARAEKDLLNSENRLNICLAHNLSKTLKAAKESIEQIQKVKDKGVFASLDRRTQAICQARIQDPEANYQELSDKLVRQGVPMTKSGISRALRRIKEIADSLGDR